MDVGLDQLRADYLVVIEDRKALQGWSEEDVRELGQMIKNAVEGEREEDVQAWAEYLAIEATHVRAAAQACREAEARIRAEREAELSGEAEVSA